MSSDYDVIVCGIGGFGSSCLYHLARRGLRVLGIDRFPVAHDRGSSHGQTRIIRKAYFEHPDYVPLLHRSYELWRELEAESGQQLMHLCGLLMCGPEDGVAISGVRRSASLYSLTADQIPASELPQRFPGFRFSADLTVLHEPDAGYLRVEDCVRAHVQQAVRHGAVVQTGDPVRSWTSTGSSVTIQTRQQTFQAAALVLTPGAWAAGLVNCPEPFPPLQVLRKVQLWFPVRSDTYNQARGGCGFFFEMPDGVFYGMPSLDGQTIKVSEHSGGQPLADPMQPDRELRAKDVEPVSRFVAQVMPDVSPDPVAHSVCLYTMTPDQHFLVDRHPEFTNVVIGAGFSGHGFKFTSALGAVLADLVQTDSAAAEADFLKLNRFLTTQPTAEPAGD